MDSAGTDGISLSDEDGELANTSKDIKHAAPAPIIFFLEYFFLPFFK